MAVSALGVEGVLGVKARYRDVAAVAEFGYRLEGEHVSIGGAVWRVTAGTTFDPQRTVLEDIWSILVDVASGADLLLETTEGRSALPTVGIVA